MFVTEVLRKDELPDYLKAVVEAHDAETFIRKSHIVETKADFKEGERAEITYVSTADLDRDGEVLLPSGCDLKEFRKAPQVLWGHNYELPPIGSDQWIDADERGIIAKTVYAQTERAEEIWQLVKQGHLKTSSVGFVPLKWVNKNEDGWSKLITRLAKSGIKIDPEKTRRIYTKWLLLEHSKVSVPANINALTTSVAKGLLKISDDTLKELGIEKPEEIKCDRIDFEYKSEEALAEMFPNMKPFPNEHACRQTSPEQYVRFRRQNDRFGKGIHAIFGVKETDGKETVELQSIRFSKDKFTAQEARKWISEHGYSCSPFEAASGERSFCMIIEEDKKPEVKQTYVQVVETADERMVNETKKAVNRALGKV